VAGRNGNRDAVHRTGGPWENRNCDSFDGKLRYECLKGEIFYSLKEVQVVIEKWGVVYNVLRPHSALGYRPAAPLGLYNDKEAINERVGCTGVRWRIEYFEHCS